MMLHSVSRMIYSWMLEIPGTSRCPTSFDTFFGGVEVPSDGTEVLKDSQVVDSCGALRLGSDGSPIVRGNQSSNPYLIYLEGSMLIYWRVVHLPKP